MLSLVRPPVCPSVTRVDQSKMVEVRIMQSQYELTLKNFIEIRRQLFDKKVQLSLTTCASGRVI